VDTSRFKHIIGNTSFFKSYNQKMKVKTHFKIEGKIFGIGKVDKNLLTSVDSVHIIHGSIFKVLQVSQICDKENKVTF